jgi:hypothetical protein
LFFSKGATFQSAGGPAQEHKQRELEQKRKKSKSRYFNRSTNNDDSDSGSGSESGRGFDGRSYEEIDDDEGDLEGNAKGNYKFLETDPGLSTGGRSWGALLEWCKANRAETHVTAMEKVATDVAAGEGFEWELAKKPAWGDWGKPGSSPRTPLSSPPTTPTTPPTPTSPLGVPVDVDVAQNMLVLSRGTQNHGHKTALAQSTKLPFSPRARGVPIAIATKTTPRYLPPPSGILGYNQKGTGQPQPIMASIGGQAPAHERDDDEHGDVEVIEQSNSPALMEGCVDC